jgi:hypothetical protein
MLDEITRLSIKGYLEAFVQVMIDEHKVSSLDPKKLRPTLQFSKNGEIKPFHEALLPDGVLRITEFERSFSTKLGTTFEEVAKIIAKKRCRKAERGFRIKGTVSNDAIARIEEIVNRISTEGMKEDGYLGYVDEVVQLASAGSSGRTSERTKIADLYLMVDDREAFFEIKSPKPNKGQCLEAADRLLQIHAMKQTGPPKVQTFYAMAYNPYGDEKTAYKHSFACKYMDLKNQVLIGSEFWELVGGTGTYEEVLGIYREVGKEKGPEMIDQLALNY